MNEYERLTDKEHGYKKCASCSYRNCQYCYDIFELKDQAYTRLTELEDKIENGTLIEIDKDLIGENIIGIHQFTDGTYELNLDENIVIGYSIDGVVTWNCTQQFNDEFRTGMFFADTEEGRAEAEARLKELQEQK